jgi:hypothetical protein
MFEFVVLSVVVEAYGRAHLIEDIETWRGEMHCPSSNGDYYPTTSDPSPQIHQPAGNSES